MQTYTGQMSQYHLSLESTHTTDVCNVFTHREKDICKQPTLFFSDC